MLVKQLPHYDAATRPTELAGALVALSIVEAELGKLADATAHAARAVALDDAALGRTHPDTMSHRTALVDTMTRTGDYAGAEREIRAALAVDDELQRTDTVSRDARTARPCSATCCTTRVRTAMAGRGLAGRARRSTSTSWAPSTWRSPR